MLTTLRVQLSTQSMISVCFLAARSSAATATLLRPGSARARPSSARASSSSSSRASSLSHPLHRCSCIPPRHALRGDTCRTRHRVLCLAQGPGVVLFVSFSICSWLVCLSTLVALRLAALVVLRLKFSSLKYEFSFIEVTSAMHSYTLK